MPLEYDDDVFVVLIPIDERSRAAAAFRLQENAKWHHLRSTIICERPSAEYRQGGTPAYCADEEDDVPERLVITFSQLEDSRNGIQFGSDPRKSHVLLGHGGTKGISSKHCNITVDKDLQIWLQDHSSKHGTAIGYTVQDQPEQFLKELRRNETWFLAHGPGVNDLFSKRTIVCGSLHFTVSFPGQVSASPRYVQNLRRFQESLQVPGMPPDVQGLDIASALTTQQPSDVHSPSEPPGQLYCSLSIIGRGNGTTVNKTIRLRDGKIFASKVFSVSCNKRPLNGMVPKWLVEIRKEFELMYSHRHNNLLEVFELREYPSPTIVMQYYPRGNMANTTLDDSTLISAFGQTLDGLSHLHSKRVAHRDIKPANILFEETPAFRIVIADFGVSSVISNSGQLKTVCGTEKYIAPEVFDGRAYLATAVDMWSLGVMSLEWFCGEPPGETEWDALEDVPEDESCGPFEAQLGREFAARVIKHIKSLPEEDHRALSALRGMLVLNPFDRLTSTACLLKGLKNGLFKRSLERGLVMDAEWDEDRSRDALMMERLAAEVNGGGTIDLPDLPDELWNFPEVNDRDVIESVE